MKEDKPPIRIYIYMHTYKIHTHVTKINVTGSFQNLAQLISAVIKRLTLKQWLIKSLT